MSLAAFNVREVVRSMHSLYRKKEPCARHEKSSCWHHDCGHYIPLDGRVLCCEPGQMLEKEPLVPWIRAIEHVSKVRYVLSSNSTIAAAM